MNFLDAGELNQLSDVCRRYAASSHDLQSSLGEFAHLFDGFFAFHDRIALQWRDLDRSTPPDVRMRSTPKAMQSFYEENNTKVREWLQEDRQSYR